LKYAVQGGTLTSAWHVYCTGYWSFRKPRDLGSPE